MISPIYNTIMVSAICHVRGFTTCLKYFEERLDDEGSFDTFGMFGAVKQDAILDQSLCFIPNKLGLICCHYVAPPFNLRIS